MEFKHTYSRNFVNIASENYSLLVNQTYLSTRFSENFSVSMTECLNYKPVLVITTLMFAFFFLLFFILKIKVTLRR